MTSRGHKFPRRLYREETGIQILRLQPRSSLCIGLNSTAEKWRTKLPPADGQLVMRLHPLPPPTGRSATPKSLSATRRRDTESWTLLSARPGPPSRYGLGGFEKYGLLTHEIERHLPADSPPNRYAGAGPGWWACGKGWWARLVGSAGGQCWWAGLLGRADGLGWWAGLMAWTGGQGWWAGWWAGLVGSADGLGWSAGWWAGLVGRAGCEGTRMVPSAQGGSSLLFIALALHPLWTVGWSALHFIEPCKLLFDSMCPFPGLKRKREWNQICGMILEKQAADK